jgi:2-oxoisovalerate dehydrogenase E2 component (dihydrolipoyl transacylase)
MKIFYLPDLGEGLSEAEIHEWYIEEGDEVKVDQPIVAMETAKAIVDVPAPFNGKIAKCFGKPGDIINTHAPLIGFATADAGTVVGNLENSDIVITEPTPPITPLANHTNKVKALPAVRNLAKQLGIDINQITGTGKEGIITNQDVLKATRQENPSPTSGKSLLGVRRIMAQTMSKSHAEIVPVSIYDDADIDNWSVDTDITIRILRAIIKACQAEPALNAWFNGNSLQRQLHNHINIGLAMDTPDGLFVPVLKNAHELSAAELRRQIETYKKQVQSRSIEPEALQGATIVLSNFGIFAGRYASPIVVPPTVAILATGRIRDEVVAYHGQAAVHRIMPISLTFDHRAATGGEATRFMAALLNDLQQSH